MESKGLLLEVRIQDSPIRGHKVALCVKKTQMVSAEHWKNIYKRLGFIDKRDANDNGIRSFFKVYLNNHPIRCYHLGQCFQGMVNCFRCKYKEHLSEYSGWDQKTHAGEWILFQ